MNAAAWFYAQSFNGRGGFAPSTRGAAGHGARLDASTGAGYRHETSSASSLVDVSAIAAQLDRDYAGWGISQETREYLLRGRVVKAQEDDQKRSDILDDVRSDYMSDFDDPDEDEDDEDDE